MKNIVGTGASVARDTQAAVQEAAKQALARLGGKKPLFGILFAAPDHDLAAALRAATAACDGTDLVGSSTAGEFTEAGLVHGGIVLLLVASTTMSHRVGFSRGVRDDHTTVAGRLAQSAGEARRSASGRDKRHHT